MSPDRAEPSRTRRAWRFMSALGCILAAASILFTVILYSRASTLAEQNTARIREIAKVQQALCVFRADIQQRVTDSENFLLDHPNGTPGITAKVIQNTINGQQRTIKALRILPCP